MFRSRLSLSGFVSVAALITAPSETKAGEVMLSCWGTVELIQGGKLANPSDERSSVSVVVDVAKKTIAVNGISWSIAGDASRDTVVGMDPDKGSVSLNRITGAVNVHFIELNGLKKFYGECKPAEKLF
jgi:hypothetical protein